MTRSCERARHLPHKRCHLHKRCHPERSLSQFYRERRSRRTRCLPATPIIFRKDRTNELARPKKCGCPTSGLSDVGISVEQFNEPAGVPHSSRLCLSGPIQAQAVHQTMITEPEAEPEKAH